MEIEQVIDKWFKETESKLAQIDNRDMVFNVCRSMFAVFKEYCDATLLLADDLKLPSKALLRVINEYYLTLMWWFNGKTSAEIENRICRSECTCCEKEKKIYEKAVTSSHKVIEEFARERLKDLGSLKSGLKVTKVAPEMEEMLDELSDQASYIYAERIMQFHRYVHFNSFVLTESVAKDKDGSFRLENDGKHLKLLCLACVFLFIQEIYNHYGWSFKEINDECNEIIAPTCEL